MEYEESFTKNINIYLEIVLETIYNIHSLNKDKEWRQENDF